MPECISQPARSQLESSGSICSYLESLIKHFCRRNDLSTYDPYDVWKTALGFEVKKLFNRHRRAGILPAGIFAFLDLLNNDARSFYTKAEYPIVRAFAALCLLNLYRKHADER